VAERRHRLGIVVLMMIGVPLVFVTGSIAVVALLLGFGLNGLPLIFSRVYSLSGEYLLTAVPMFMLMASILEKSGVARDLYDAMHVWAGKLRGGLALQTTVVAATIMATMTGIIGGEIVLLGLVALPQMLRLGYDRKLAIGTICAGGALGTMIPPSIVLIIYGLDGAGLDRRSVRRRVHPGAADGRAVHGLHLGRCTLNPTLGPPAHGIRARDSAGREAGAARRSGAADAGRRQRAGHIYGGIASVTEAAGIGVLGAALRAARGNCSVPMLRESVLQTMRTCGMLIWLTFGASALIGVYNLIGGTRLRQAG
jgi:TRAP-type mannitol/chloroaromatic compound transport system permease large subunit